MSTRNLAWGVTGGVSLLLAMACSGKNVHDVGDVDDGGESGSGGGGNVAGSTGPEGGFGNGGFGSGGFGSGGFGFAGTYETGGTGSGGLITAGTYTGGSSYAGSGFGFAGTGYGGFGVGGGAAECFDPPNYYTEGAPASAPQNTIFVDAHGVVSDVVKNYADQQVFTNIGGLWETYANFPASTAATDTAILLPAQLAQVPANLAQFYFTRTDCAGKPAAGHKLTVEFWWKHGAIVKIPTHGVALGTVSNKGKAVWFEDSAKGYVTGEPDTKRLMNTLNKLVVEHSFAEDDQTDAGKVTLGLWLLPDAEFPSTFYVGNVKWD